MSPHKATSVSVHLREDLIQAPFLLGLEEELVQLTPPPTQVGLPYVFSSSHLATVLEIRIISARPGLCPGSGSEDVAQSDRKARKECRFE